MTTIKIDIERIELSAGTDGRGILVAGTGTGNATTIHQAQAGQVLGCYDEIYLYAYNLDTVRRTVALCWGGMDAKDINLVDLDAAGAARVRLVSGEVLRNGLYVKAYCAAAANKIVISGYVNRLTETVT